MMVHRRLFGIFLLMFIFFSLIFNGCASPNSQKAQLEEKTAEPSTTEAKGAHTLTIDEKRRHLGDNRMPESRSVEWAPVRDPEAPFFETEFALSMEIKNPLLKINTFGSESEANPVYLNGKKVGSLCIAFDIDGWKSCEIKLSVQDLKEKNSIRIETAGGDRDDLMIEGIYILYEE